MIGYFCTMLLSKLMFVSFLLFFIVLSCSKETASNKDKIITDSSILSKEKMIGVLTDIHFAELAADEKHLQADSAQQLLMEYYSEVFKIHQINSIRFFKSYDYYITRPEKMGEIYQEIAKELTKKSEILKNK